MIRAIQEIPINFKINLEYFPIIAYSYAFFMSIYLLFSPYLSVKLIKSYNKLTCNQKLDWNCR